VVFALLAQIAAFACATPTPPTARDAGPVTFLGIMCHAEGPVAEHPGSGHHPAADCAACPLCQSMARPFTLPPPPADLPAPRLLLARLVAATPPATGPPAAAQSRPYPRGPPTAI
jgi:hypothetical protein